MKRFANRLLSLVLIFIFSTLAARGSLADAPSLALSFGDAESKVTAAELLADPSAQDIEVQDPSYGRAMQYRAVPLSRLVPAAKIGKDQVVEAAAADGFAAMLPRDLVLRKSQGLTQAFLAIEPPGKPWPALPGKPVSAGPFYVVWTHPEAAGVRSEQWPYQVVALRAAESPARRWPALGVDPRLPAEDPRRAGEALFVTQCMTCHKLNGAGDAETGPDLNLPRSPTEYFKPRALAAYIRDPASQRRWPAMQMKGFTKDQLSDREINLILVYLAHMAERRGKAQ
jgi:mono/diheme cytochrome c family protein